MWQDENGWLLQFQIQISLFSLDKEYFLQSCISVNHIKRDTQSEDLHVYKKKPFLCYFVFSADMLKKINVMSTDPHEAWNQCQISVYWYSSFSLLLHKIQDKVILVYMQREFSYLWSTGVHISSSLFLGCHCFVSWVVSWSRGDFKLFNLYE